MNEKLTKVIFLEKQLVAGGGQSCYQQYVAAIIDLGKYCQQTILVNIACNNDLEKIRQREFKQRQFSSEEESKLNTFKLQLDIPVYEFSSVERLGRHFVKIAWKGKEVKLEDDDDDGGDDEEPQEALAYYSYRQQNRLKRIASNTYLKASTRDYFDIGMSVLDNYCPHPRSSKPMREELQESGITIAEDEEEYNRCEMYHLMMANQAIQTYKTIRQKIIHVISQGLSFLAAIACGILLAVGVFVVGHTVLVVVLASIVFCAAVVASHELLKGRTYSFLNYLYINVRDLLRWMVGKKPVGDCFEYVNENGEISELSTGKKFSLPILYILGISVGLAQVGLVAGAFIGVHYLFGFAFLTVGLAGSICFPIACVLLAATLICFTGLVFKEQLKVLQEKNIRKAVFRPFKEFIETIEEVFSQENVANKHIPLHILKRVKKRAYTALISVEIISILGLIGLSVVAAIFMIPVLVALFHIGFIPALVVSFGICVGLSLPSEGLFQLSSIAEGMKKSVVECWNLYTKVSNDTKNKFADRPLRPEDKFWATLSFSSNLINALGNGFLVGGTMHNIFVKFGISIAIVIILSSFFAFAEFDNNFFPVIAAEELDTDEENTQAVEKIFERNHYKKITQNLLEESLLQDEQYHVGLESKGDIDGDSVIINNNQNNMSARVEVENLNPTVLSQNSFSK